MKNKIFTISALSCFIGFLGLISCSSGDDNNNDIDKPNSGTTSGITSGTIPQNTDTGNNNNSEPDNIKPDNSGNTGGSDNSGNNGGSDNSGNTGGSDNSGNTGSDNSGNTGSDNSGNTGGSDNSGNTGGSDNSGNIGGSDNSGNTGGSDNSGNTGGSDNSGNTGGSDNSGNSGDKDQVPTWKLVFEDNFEGTDSIPNPQYWSLTPKGDDTWNRHMSESYGQAYQKDGYLYLFGMMANGEYLTGGIESREKFDFTYGQVKCRARFLRQPQGNHTGIWMMPEPPAEKWPRSGEIDIMEHLDDQKLIYETVHFWDGYNEEEGKDASKDDTVYIDNEDFNVYGVIWDKNSVSFTVNGEVKFSYKNDKPESEEFNYQYPFTKPFYLILSQSLGGKGTWEGVIDDKELPAIFQIDWIKVWQKSE